MSHRDTFVVSGLRCDKSHRRGEACAYRVSWAINPHMRVGEVAFKTAWREHRRLCSALQSAGAELVELPFVHSAFDSVFSKDNAVLVARGERRRALITTPLHGERAAEQHARADTYAQLGFDVCAAPKHHLEGGDVAILANGDALLGHGPRSSPRAAAELEAFLGTKVTPLELVDPYFFHLDVALAALSDGTVLFTPEAFTRAACQTIERLDGVTRLVPIAGAVALGFGLNLIEVGKTVIVGAQSPEVERALSGIGYTPVVVPLKQFHLSGGSAACLAAKIHTQN